MPVTNVPAPGGPIRSNWAISVSNVANAAETAIPTKVAKAGDTLTGNLVVGQDPNPSVAGAEIGATAAVSGQVRVSNAVDSQSHSPAPLVLRKTQPGTSVGVRLVSFLLGTGNNVVGTITVASGTTIAYNTSSDPRLKTEVGPITDAAERVRALGAAAYRGRWVNDSPEAAEWDLVDATDVAAAAPYAVTGEQDAVDDDGSIIAMQVAYPALVPLLLAAVSELVDRVEMLEAGAG